MPDRSQIPDEDLSKAADDGTATALEFRATIPSWPSGCELSVRG
jgi:hypothetical protein